MGSDIHKSSQVGFMKLKDNIPTHNVFNETNNNDPLSVPPKRMEECESKDNNALQPGKFSFKKKVKTDSGLSTSSDLWNTEMRLFDNTLKRKSGLKKPKGSTHEMKSYPTTVVRLPSDSQNNAASLAVTVTCSSTCGEGSPSTSTTVNNNFIIHKNEGI